MLAARKAQLMRNVCFAVLPFHFQFWSLFLILSSIACKCVWVCILVRSCTQWNRACLASHRLAQEQCIGGLVECCDRYYWHRHDEIYTEHSTPHNTLLNESKCTTCTPNEMNNKEPENSEEMKKEYKKNMQRKVRALPLDLFYFSFVNDDRWRNVSIETEMTVHFKRQQFELNVDFADFQGFSVFNGDTYALCLLNIHNIHSVKILLIIFLRNIAAVGFFRLRCDKTSKWQPKKKIIIALIKLITINSQEIFLTLITNGFLIIMKNI